VLGAKAKPSDLTIGAPPGTREAPLNPQEMLEREGQNGNSGKSR
jgi:hypothetical protein